MTEDIVSVLRDEKEINKNKKKSYRTSDGIDHDKEIAADLSKRIAAVKALCKENHVDWHNLKDVQARSVQYLEWCEKSETLPSAIGLAVFGFGVTIQGMNAWVRNNPWHPSAQFIQMVKDEIADSVQNAGLRNHCNNIMAIFALKNGHQFTDTVQLQPVPPPEECHIDADTIRQRYLNFPGMDDITDDNEEDN